MADSPEQPSTSPAPNSMKTAIPFAVDVRTTEPSSDSAITIMTPQRELDARANDRSPATSDRAGRDHHRHEVDGEHVDDADARGAEEAREKQRRATHRPHDERL